MILLNSKRFANCYYQKIGEGFPIILLHGFGEDARIWEKQVEVLQNYFTVIVPDIPGSGQSTLPLETMSMELMADYIKEIMGQEGIEQTILFGHSMGGYAALAFALTYSSCLLGLGLVHSSAFEDTVEKKKVRDQGVSILQKGGKEQFLKALIPFIYSELSKTTFLNEINQHLTRALEISSEALIAYYLAMKNRPDRTEVLRNATFPVFIFAGKEDPAVPMPISLQQGYLAKHTHFEMIEGIGHMGMYEASEQLNESIIAYCDFLLTAKKT
jgi:pimeloyl-ACP methyl ester carboxylesterase